MNQNLTEIVVVLDKSGSMGTIRNDTIVGFNTFLDEQKKSADGKARLTLVTFNGAATTVIDSTDINEVEPLDGTKYRTAGGTALLDAIGQTIENLEKRYTDEEDPNKVPGKVIFAIITDGEENSSKLFNKSKVTDMIKHQTKRHGWEFAFLGANLDAVKEAQSIGISSGTFNFEASSRGISDSFGVLNSATLSYRSSGVATYDINGTSLEGMNKGSNIDTKA